MNVVRIPFLWERLQPTLGAALNTAYLGYIIDVLKDANTAGLKVVLDMHNYGGYNLNGSGTVYHFGYENAPTSAQYADVWTKLSLAIQAEPLAAAAVYAYDIMNEPYDLYDSRGTVPTSGSTLIGTFAATDEGWISSTGGTTTITQSASYSGSLKVSRAAVTGSGIVFGAQLNAGTLQVAPGNGLTFRIRGNVPVTSPGSSHRIRMTVYDNAYGPHQVPSNGITVTKGQDFEAHMTFTSGDLNLSQAIVVELIVDGATNTAPIDFYISEIRQGTAIVGLSPQKTWEAFSQAAVDAIRSVNDNSLLFIEGYSFASANQWATNHPTKWITDSANNIMYSAHQYFDDNESGTYINAFSAETTSATGQGHASVAARAVTRVKNFTDWCTAQGVKGFLGEFGWPNSASSADSTSWDAVGTAVLTHLDSVNMGATLWATGSWLSPTDNKLNAYVLMNPPMQVLSPALILEAHPGR